MITQEHTSSLEDIIIKRIVEAKFNDLVPAPERDTRFLDEENPNDIGLSQEKDKLGLGEIYANEYLAKTMEDSTTDQAKKMKGGDDERRADIKSLFLKVCI